MASVAAAASGLRQHLSRTLPQPLLLSSPLCHSRHRQHHRLTHRAFSLLATLSFPSLASYFSPPRPRPRPHSLSAAEPRGLLTDPASASPPAARAPLSPQHVLMDEDEDEGNEEEVEEAFDVASYDDEEYAEEDDDDQGEEDLEVHGQVGELESESLAPEEQELPRLPSPKLSVKEKKELAAYAHSLGKKLKSQQVGKSGVTPSVVAAFVETLEANELLKLKVHGSCPGELPEVIKLLEESTGSVAVGRIGRSVILYRPSLSKMQRKESAAVKRAWRPKPKEPANGLKLQKKRPIQRLSNHRTSNSANRI